MGPEVNEDKHLRTNEAEFAKEMKTLWRLELVHRPNKTKVFKPEPTRPNSPRRIMDMQMKTLWKLELVHRPKKTKAFKPMRPVRSFLCGFNPPSWK